MWNSNYRITVGKTSESCVHQLEKKKSDKSLLVCCLVWIKQQAGCHIRPWAGQMVCSTSCFIAPLPGRSLSAKAQPTTDNGEG